MNHDPSKTSFYISNDYYQRLVEDFAGWQTDAREVHDLNLRDACRRLLDKEARLLDERRYDDWLGLYAPECLYWVPSTVEGGDPRREIAVAFDDRRRLEDRIFRLKSEFAWSQQPRSRTARIVSNVAVFASDDASALMVRSSFLVTELQAGDFRTYTGWAGYKLRDRGDSFAILVKQVNLIDCDQNLRNPSIIL
jgi:benzoate/toluate 1,2-dioxygenase beta subunit